MVSPELPKPEYARNMRLLGHSNMGGRPDGQQVMVNQGYAYVGHMFSQGFSVIDVRDPRAGPPARADRSRARRAPGGPSGDGDRVRARTALCR